MINDLFSPASGDYAHQTRFVAASAWRLLELQDRDPLSPSHGCFHYAYWRDKTSEFPDARFQEAGAALGLLSLPFFDDLRAEGILPDAERLYAAFSAALENLARQQYPEGCFDEWYKGERGFAATEFPMIAFGLAAHLMGDVLRPGERSVLVNIMNRAAGWLGGRHDRVKANHEAAAAAAMAVAWEVTGNQEWLKAAKGMMADTLSRQKAEGWFPEVGGMDLGYCSVLLDYMMLYMRVSGDQGPLESAKRLARFMLPLIHPDGTISPEAGLCLNPYVGRLGLGLLSPHDEGASVLVSRFLRGLGGAEGLRPILADDLRLCRWSYLPLTATLLQGYFQPSPSELEAIYPQGWTAHPESCVQAYHQGDLHVYLLSAGGGVVRVYRGFQLVLQDRGLALWARGTGWGCLGYDRKREVTATGNGYRLKSHLAAAAFFYPSFLARLVLRIGCTVPQFSYWLRALIDAYRLRNATAINQSAAPIAGGRSPYVFTRTVLVEEGVVSIEDRLETEQGLLEIGQLSFDLVVRGCSPVVDVVGAVGTRLRMVKRLTADGILEVESRLAGADEGQ